MLALLILLLPFSCTPDRRPEARDPVDLAFAVTPGDFKGLAPCAGERGCTCCCQTRPCIAADLHPCDLPDMYDLPEELIPPCTACRAGDLDAGAACTVTPK